MNKSERKLRVGYVSYYLLTKTELPRCLAVLAIHYDIEFFFCYPSGIDVENKTITGFFLKTVTG